MKFMLDSKLKIHNSKLISTFLVVIFSFSFLVFNFNLVQGAELFFESQTDNIKPGDHFQVDLYLMPEKEDINAIEGKIIVPEHLAEVREIIDGDSIITFWTKKPLIDGNSINFGGIMPGGFKGVMDPFKKGLQPGRILSLILLAKDDGDGEISLEDTKVFLNDGRGTEAKSSITNFQFSINIEAPAIAGVVPISDPDAPEPFQPIVARDPKAFNNQWFLAFVAQDKGSGIDYYAVQENRKQKIENRMWVKGESPYLLQDQKLRSYIYVKAVDKAGNERVAMVEPKNPASWYDNYWFGVIIILGIILGFAIWRKIKFKRKNAK